MRQNFVPQFPHLQSNLCTSLPPPAPLCKAEHPTSAQLCASLISKQCGRRKEISGRDSSISSFSVGHSLHPACCSCSKHIPSLLAAPVHPAAGISSCRGFQHGGRNRGSSLWCHSLGRRMKLLLCIAAVLIQHFSFRNQRKPDTDSDRSTTTLEVLCTLRLVSISVLKSICICDQNNFILFPK